MLEEKQIPGWRKRFLANRMAFESILFEKELVTPKEEKSYKGILVLLAIFAFHALLLTQAVLRNGMDFRREDSKNLEIVRMYGSGVAADGWSAVFLPKLSGPVELKPPLYYLTFLPASRLFPGKPSRALALVNSFYLLLIMLTFYYAVRKRRNIQFAWLAASLAAAFPFIIALGRRVSPDLAFIAFVSGVYCCYINCDDFKNRKWCYALGVFFALGMFTDTRFLVYTLPLLPFLANGYLDPLTKKNMRPLIVLTLLIPVPWYIRNVFFTFVRDTFISNSLASAAGFGAFSMFNLVRDLPLLLDGLHLFFLPLGGAALLWLFVSLFMAYEEKEMLMAWFLVPFCLFAMFSRSAGNLYPAFMPFALAAGIMTPAKARNYILGLTLFFPLLYQLGFAPYVDIKLGGRDVGVFGLKPAKSGDLKNAEAVKAVCAGSSGRPAIVQLVGSDDYFNPDSLRSLAVEQGCGNMSFVHYPKDWMGLADYVLYKTASFASAHMSGEFREHSGEIARPDGWFRTAFREEAVFEQADTSKLFLFAKATPSSPFLPQGVRTFEKLSVGPVEFEDAILDVGEFDASTGKYDTVQFFVPHFKYRGMDIYSLKLRFDGLSLVPLADDFSDVRVTGCETVRVLLLRLREDTLNAILKLKSSDFQNLRVQLDNGLTLSGSYRDIGVKLGFDVAPGESGLRMKLNRIVFGFLEFAVPGSLPPRAEAASPQRPPDYAGAPSDRRKTAAADPGPSAIMKAGKELSQFKDDPAAAQLLKDSGYDKIAAKLIAMSEENEASQSAAAPKQAPPKATGGVISQTIIGLFSINYDFMGGKTMPFRIKAKDIVLRNGLMTVR